MLEAEPMVRTVISQILIGAGYTVLATDRLHSALEALDVEYIPALLITDVNVPGPQAPEALNALINRHWPTVPILVVSGFLSEAGTQGMRSGVYFLPKPFTAHQLLSKVNEAMASSIQHPAGPPV